MITHKRMVVGLATLLIHAGLVQSAAGPAPAAWLEQAQRGIRSPEYNLTWENRTPLAGLAAAWQAPNRAHNLRVYFSGSGVRVIPRIDQSQPWEWALTLTGYGRGRTLVPVESVVPVVTANRVTYD